MLESRGSSDSRLFYFCFIVASTLGNEYILRMPDRNSPILSVSEITRQIKGTLEEGFSHVAVKGEISNFHRHSSGHLYFTLKDERSQLQAVMWRTRAQSLFFTPQEGMKAIAHGSITVYEVRGNYQLDVALLQPMGVGELQLAFERLKQQLASEGLFDKEHKKPLPPFPRKIGIVTSPTGAAIHDIINVIGRRFPAVELLLVPVKVQGTGAADEIAEAIKDLNAVGGVDLMIVGRGGGSLEDLWAFNEEIVARAIYASAVPVVSAVGHEIDFTIADFVADLRAPTPSAAAELVVPDRTKVIELLRNYCYTADRSVEHTLSTEKEAITNLLRSYSFNRPADILRQHIQHLDEMQSSMEQALSHRIALTSQSVQSLQKRIESVHPRRILERGYSLVRRDGKIMTRVKFLHEKDEIEIEMSDGTTFAQVHS